MSLQTNTILTRHSVNIPLIDFILLRRIARLSPISVAHACIRNATIAEESAMYDAVIDYIATMDKQTGDADRTNGNLLERVSNSQMMPMLNSIVSDKIEDELRQRADKLGYTLVKRR